MSTEKGVGERLSSEGTHTSSSGTTLEERDLQQTQAASTQSPRVSPPKPKEEGERSEEPGALSTEDERKPQATRDESAETVAQGAAAADSPRQVIAVSASKGPAAFFNLARKFLVTDDMCDLSALEGAIVSAVDAAHLLERSQLATIVRIHTSYVTVEPKRRKQAPQQTEQDEEVGRQAPTQSWIPTGEPVAPESTSKKYSKVKAEAPQHRDEGTTQAAVQPSRQSGSRGSSGGRELRRARIVITVQRTEGYKKWLEENPLQAIIAVDADADDPALDQAPGGRKTT